MECAICFDEITKETGCATLSCQHTFHFRCIDSWFGKQVWDDLPQTCPCCRSEGGHLDRCEVMEGDEEEDDDDETYEEEESVADSEELLIDRINEQLPRGEFLLERNNTTGQLLITSLDHIAMERFRNLFGYLNEIEENGPASAPLPEAARKIQALVRGHLARNFYTAARGLMALRR